MLTQQRLSPVIKDAPARVNVRDSVAFVGLGCGGERNLIVTGRPRLMTFISITVSRSPSREAGGRDLA